ncbi:TPA: site-specific integrase [Streptococcus agalactiae]|nr:site-specific integrase [Streptococcus agalactiae]
MKINEVKKKDGTVIYRASVYLGTDKVTGKKVTTKITGRTKKEVREKAKQGAVEFIKNGSTRFKATSVTSYQELATLWWDSYKHTVKYNTQLADKTNKGERKAYLHYDRIHALNKRILQYGVIMQAIPFNPAREVILPRNTKKANTKRVKHFENDELRTFFNYLNNLDKSKYRNFYEVTLYKFLLATGCRINEALALNWSDIDLDNAVVHITKTLNYKQEINSPKSKSSYRDIDIDSQTITMLKQYRRRQIQEAWKLGRSETVVFSDFIHKYPNNRTLQTRLRTHFKRANVPNIGFHGFRHTHASLLLNTGIPYKELQYRLGHSTLSMTMDIYSHLSKENAKKAVSFFETAINSI